MPIAHCAQCTVHSARRRPLGLPSRSSQLGVRSSQFAAHSPAAHSSPPADWGWRATLAGRGWPRTRTRPQQSSTGALCPLVIINQLRPIDHTPIWPPPSNSQAGAPHSIWPLGRLARRLVGPTGSALARRDFSCHSNILALPLGSFRPQLWQLNCFSHSGLLAGPKLLPARPKCSPKLLAQNARKQH